MIETAPNGQSLLWEVTGGFLQEPSYVLGTMHIMCAEDAVLSATVASILSQVYQVYLEVDWVEVETLSDSAVSANMHNNTTLAHLLSEDDYNRVRLFFEQYLPHLPFSNLEQQQPMMLSSALFELFLPCENKSGMDLMIMEEARRCNKPVKGLETVAFQVALMNSIAYNEQANDLVKAINNIEVYKEYACKMITLYNKQDIDQLHEMAIKEEAVIGAHTNKLLYDRNTSWVNQFQEITSENTTLFAVGAGHLGGSRGVINLLKNTGYTLRPLSNLPHTTKAFDPSGSEFLV